MKAKNTQFVEQLPAIGEKIFYDDSYIGEVKYYKKEEYKGKTINIAMVYIENTGWRAIVKIEEAATR